MTVCGFRVTCQCRSIPFRCVICLSPWAKMCLNTHTHISISASSSRKATVGYNLGLCMERMSSKGALEIVPERDVEIVGTDLSTRAAVCVADLMRGSRCLFLHLVNSICFLPWKSQSFFPLGFMGCADLNPSRAVKEWRDWMWLWNCSQPWSIMANTSAGCLHVCVVSLPQHWHLVMLTANR